MVSSNTKNTEINKFNISTFLYNLDYNIKKKITTDLKVKIQNNNFDKCSYKQLSGNIFLIITEKLKYLNLYHYKIKYFTYALVDPATSSNIYWININCLPEGKYYFTPSTYEMYIKKFNKTNLIILGLSSDDNSTLQTDIISAIAFTTSYASENNIETNFINLTIPTLEGDSLYQKVIKPFIYNTYFEFCVTILVLLVLNKLTSANILSTCNTLLELSSNGQDLTKTNTKTTSSVKEQIGGNKVVKLTDTNSNSVVTTLSTTIPANTVITDSRIINYNSVNSYFSAGIKAIFVVSPIVAFLNNIVSYEISMQNNFDTKLLLLSTFSYIVCVEI
jgi:hypothetical protein